MSNKVYLWKRFWCPRATSVSLADNGYLYDPDLEWSKVYNPDLVTAEQITGIPCLVLLGEPGIGKTQELENLRAQANKDLEPWQILSLNLRACESLKEDLFENEFFVNWLEGTYCLHLFLDSLDEGILSIPTIAVGLIDELSKSKYKDHISRLYLRLACRTFAFPFILEKGLKELWKDDYVGIYELAPLRRIDVIEAAKVEGLPPNEFLEEVSQKDVVSLAIKPITLKFLLNTYRRHNGRFAPGQGLHELYLEGCKLLCEEINQSRQAANRVGNLDSSQRLIVAARIAAITILTNRFAIWTSINQGDIPSEDVPLQSLCFGYETANEREFIITKTVVKEVLDTGLFSSRGANRMGWAHQTYAEFLAAWYLTQHKIPQALINEIFFSALDAKHKLVPQLQETAAWLASMECGFLREVIKTDPDILLQSDVPTDQKIRELIVASLLEQYECGNLYDIGRNSYRNLKKLNHLGLGDQLCSYIQDSNKQFDARELAIEIAESCRLSELQEELVKLALDPSELIHLRASAARAINFLESSEAKLKLKPLVSAELPEDENDALKGYVLKGLWPNHISIEDLLSVLSPPRKRNYFGAYQFFIEFELAQNLHKNDLFIALNWLEKQGVRLFGHPFDQLGNFILLKSWENFDIPQVAEGFTKVALVQWREHQKIITRDGAIKDKFSSLLLADKDKRHILIEKAVSIISETGEDPSFLISTLTDDVLSSRDIFWMLEKIQASNCRNTQSIWAQLIEWSFDRSNASQIGEILVITQTNETLREAFSHHFEPVELHSALAEKKRANYRETREAKDKYESASSNEVKFNETIIQALEQLESGDLSAWQRLNIEISLKPERGYYDFDTRLNITELAFWQKVDETIRERVLKGAKNYIHSYNDIDYKWIEAGNRSEISVLGCRAFQILLNGNPAFADQIPFDVWKKWTPIIVATSSYIQPDVFHLELVRHAYLKAPQIFLETLTTLINIQNQRNSYIFIIDCLDKCWDDQLELFLIEKAKDPNLTPYCMGQLLEKLLKCSSTKARDLAKSLIVIPLPEDAVERDRILIAARVIVENSDISSWAYLWSLIQQDPSFGCKVLELVACRYSHGIPLALNEDQLADLYIWLVNQYPYNEDPDHSHEIMAYSPTARDGIARFRDEVLSQLRERGTLKACTEIQRVVEALPEITWLKNTLIVAQENMRRKTWKPLSPENFLQLIAKLRITNSDLSGQISVADERIKRMDEEPKITNNIHAPNSQINAPIGTSGTTNSQVNINSSDLKKGGDWLNLLGLILTAVGILASIAFSGVFNAEFKQWLNHVFPSAAEQEIAPKQD